MSKTTSPKRQPSVWSVFSLPPSSTLCKPAQCDPARKASGSQSNRCHSQKLRMLQRRMAGPKINANVMQMPYSTSEGEAY